MAVKEKKREKKEKKKKKKQMRLEESSRRKNGRSVSVALIKNPANLYPPNVGLTSRV